VAERKIPAPSSEVQLAWTRKGVGNWNLVFDKGRGEWRVVKRDAVASNQVTYDNYNAGQNTYTVTTPGRGGALDVSEETTARQEAQDPLYKYVRDFGLQVVTDPTNGRTELKGFSVVNGKVTNEVVPYYLYLDSKGKINLSQDYDAIKKTALDDLKATGKLNTLFQDLYNKKLISKETYDSKNLQAADFNAALVGTINEYSKSVIGNRQFDPTQTQAPDFLSFLQTGIAGRGGGEANLPRREFQDISKEQLNAFIDGIYLETIGRKPTEEQRSAKLKELNKIVKRGIVTTTTKEGGEIVTRSKGGFNESEQALKLQEQLRQENPLEYERRQAFDFMDELQKIMSGGI